MENVTTIGLARLIHQPTSRLFGSLIWGFGADAGHSFWWRRSRRVLGGLAALRGWVLAGGTAASARGLRRARPV